MKFIIIIPAHNEEATILKTLASLSVQTYQDFDVVVVNDGSTDQTQRLVADFIENDTRFKMIQLPPSQHQPGAKVVRTFNAGLSSVDWSNYEIICKFDADIIFPKDYLARLQEVYAQNPKAGMVSGLVYIEKEGQWVFENLSSKNHVRGPIKSYRKACFTQMNGLREVLGWDNIDVMLAQMHGYQVVAIKDLWVKHLRPTAYKYQRQKARKLGEYFYNIGLNWQLAMVSSLKSSFKNQSVTEFFITMATFLKQNQPRVLSAAEIKYIRTIRNPLQRWFVKFKK
ncbi:glycosyltransferase family 2 protein [Riemerella columbina]|uniref:glycosyltransferase family 2 protein n=1 Tax=Riemerella columbina TaxID=103810 RepID=UPI002670BF6D|nr:glycosyltransferase family 2 protein [Riemerella columbina]WKS95982.1 glycosyltransferase family 2 protein [Riemerella columbina]